MKEESVLENVPSNLTYQERINNDNRNDRYNL